jgi:kynurenine formamidase
MHEYGTIKMTMNGNKRECFRMKKITDITGSVYTGMWNYEPPFPKFCLQPLPEVPWVKGKVFCEIFEGVHSQTGTYLETPAHYFGNDRSYLITDVPVEKLYEMNCTIVHLERYFEESEQKKEQACITISMLKDVLEKDSPCEGSAILLSTGWGAAWEKEYFLDKSPYIKKEAMEYLISLKPYLLGSDFPRWDNIRKSEGFFQAFYDANILMLAPCVNLHKISSVRCKLTVLPLKIEGTSCTPCRAVIVEEMGYHGEGCKV